MTQAEQAAGRPANRGPEEARQIEARKVTRRSFLRVSIFAGLTLTVFAHLAGFLGFFNLLKPKGFGGTVTVVKGRIPEAGDDPARISEGKFWLANLEGAQGDVLQVGGTGGLLAMWWKCPHLGCTIPWRSDFRGASVNFAGIDGWFRCPCHGSTFSRAGIRVFGPAPRPMDTMEVTVNSDGSINVNTGKITFGGSDNPLRSVRYNG
ncbi:MAG TPA: Rieske 2Fe-2S domain-containing protein [Dehalococcoidia bacterium]|nr:Rieske 2Fe-2S domain-containing protein [Dehalococcoidia bacterium]